MQEYISGSVLMIQSVAFGFNPETATNNSYTCY